MAAIPNYDALKDEIDDWLNRDDLGTTAETFIWLAEEELRRDRRVRRQSERTFTVSSESENLPTGFVEMEALYHDGPTYYHEIEIVSADMLAEIKRRNGADTGTPTHAAIINGTSVRLAPAPDESYDLRLVWWETVPHLGSSRPTNWLIDNHSDIYLFASLVQSAPYVRDEERLPMWRMELERRLEDMHTDSERKRYSGSLVKQTRNPIP